MGLGNIGNFAGGLAQGLQTGQRMNIAREDQSMRERQLKMQEQDQAYQEEQRQGQRDAQTEYKAIYQKWYGEREEDDGFEQVDDGMGNVKQVARKRKVAASHPGAPGSQARDLGFLADTMGAQMRRTGDPSKMVPIFEYLQTTRGTEVGKNVLGAMNGDQAKFDALVKELGGDPSKAQVIPDKFQLDLGNGKVTDLKQYLLLAGADKFYAALQKDSEGKRQERVADSQVRAADARTNLVTAQAGVIPAQIDLLRARAQAARASSGTGGAGGAKLSAQVLNQIKTATTDSMTGKPDAEAASWVMQRVSQSKDPMADVGRASEEYRASVKEVKGLMRAHKGDLSVLAKKLQAKGINVDPANRAAIESGLRQLALGRFTTAQISAPAAPAGSTRNVAPVAAAADEDLDLE
jgi:hypothetical protein